MSTTYKDKIVITYNIDKGGNDTSTSVRLLNRKKGNLMKHTYPIATVGRPVCECYKNEKDTIFNGNYPTEKILQGLVDDSFFTLIIMTPSRECHSWYCENRSIAVRLLTRAGRDY